MDKKFLPELKRCNALLDKGYSLIPIRDNKVPVIKWKSYEAKQLEQSEFENFYNLDKTKLVGIVTGYNDFEVVDIDTKIFPTAIKKREFWNEFYQMLQDNIEDFDKKFIIVKTLSGGFHICYKTKIKGGNIKIARVKEYKEALIESRGVGGYVIMYTEFVQGSSYLDVDYISDSDRTLLWECAKTYNHIEEDTIDYKEIEPKREVKENEVTTWQDYNNRHSVYDLISSEFEIVRKTSDKLTIRRLGAKSPHSGYIYNSNLLYLFSTGTLYPNEKALSPFAIYAIQKYNGDYSQAAKELYKEGYGSRYKKSNPVKIKPVNNAEIIQTDDFPLDVFPENIQTYIYNVHKTLNASVDYLGCSFLWVLSLCVGNSIKLEVKKGWTEAAVLWIAIVGKAGIGKTHNIASITRPLQKVNQREIEQYTKQMSMYDDYCALEKKEKKTAEEISEPQKKQFIVGDITMEAFVDYHSHNKNGIGILRDELSGWIKDLNKYRQGSDLENYLSCWSNQLLNLTRKTAKSSYVPDAFVPIIGGVQPSILSSHYTEENKDNGFIDRWLLCFPDLEIESYNEAEMEEESLFWYNEYVVGLYELVKNKITQYYDDGNINPYIARFSDDAKNEWIRIFNKITKIQNSDEENEYMKSILPKQKSYVARFSLLLSVLDAYNCEGNYQVVTKKAILGAERLSDYFIKMAKKNKVDSLENKKLNDDIKASGKRDSFEIFEMLYNENTDVNKTKLAEELNVSRSTVYNWAKKIDSVQSV